MNPLVVLKDSKKLLNILYRNNYSQIKFALKCGIHPNTMNRVFRCNPILPGTACKICSFLELEFEEYFEVYEKQ